MNLQPGDVLLYAPRGFYGWIIRLKTWHRVSHCEIVIGQHYVAASRDGIGVGKYPLRTDGLIAVLRPKVPFDLPAAARYIESMLGTPYGWGDLLAFFGASKDYQGIVCSPFVTEALRAGGVPVFNHEPANAVAPFMFLDSELLLDVTQAVLA